MMDLLLLSQNGKAIDKDSYMQYETGFSNRINSYKFVELVDDLSYMIRTGSTWMSRTIVLSLFIILNFIDKLRFRQLLCDVDSLI